MVHKNRTLAPKQELPLLQANATRGTIAMKIDAVKNAPVPALSDEDLLAADRDGALLVSIEVDRSVRGHGR